MKLFIFPIIILGIIIVGFLTFGLLMFISNIRKKIRIRKRIRNEHRRKKELIRTSDYIKSHKLGEYLKYGYSYCDYCGTKLFDGEAHDTQKCLINKYSHVVIK